MLKRDHPWLTEIAEHHRTHPKNAPKVLAGTVGSGNSLVKRVSFVRKLIDGHRNMLCVEMEAAGAYHACNTGKQETPLLVVRGISDVVGFRRDGEWTEYACQSAAALAMAMIRAGHLLPPTDPAERLVLEARGSSEETSQLRDEGDFHLRLALRNIHRYGDTDIFPKPFELGAFRDCEDAALQLLGDMERGFEDFFPRYPPQHVSALSQSGFIGFRWAAQLDPLYNAFLLSQTISLAAPIEAARIPLQAEKVFSYRYAPDLETGRIFDEDANWEAFKTRANTNADSKGWVVKTDIADFYPRVSHERLRVALESIERGSVSAGWILQLLAHYAGDAGCGLPVGGPAARILSEAYLASSDMVLRAKGITFCRFADDYLLFADTKAGAYDLLADLATVLAKYEGLSLQKLKTRVMSKTEYLRTYFHEDDADLDKESYSFLRLRIRFDPYSPTAEEDYETLCSHLSAFDILGMLAREMRKSRVHQQLTKKLLFAARFIKPADQDSAVITIAENLGQLLSVFSSVAALLFHLLQEIEADTRAYLERRLRALLETSGDLVLLELHRMTIVRMLASLDDADDDVEDVIWQELETQQSPLVRKECIWALVRLSKAALVRPLLHAFDSSTSWERRAILAASYLLGEEGERFRRRVQPQTTPLERLVLQWSEQRGGDIFQGDEGR